MVLGEVASLLEGTMDPTKTERVPYELDGIFARASETVSEFFANRIHSPDRGVIEVAGERYVLVRGGPLSAKFFALVRALWPGPARGSR